MATTADVQKITEDFNALAQDISSVLPPNLQSHVMLPMMMMRMAEQALIVLLEQTHTVQPS
jgi:hypothetical protein